LRRQSLFAGGDSPSDELVSEPWAVEKLSWEDGTSMNRFLVVAAAEKLAFMQAELFFEERKARADRRAFSTILNRGGGAALQPGDEPSA
jgi:hypothetical protein